MDIQWVTVANVDDLIDDDVIGVMVGGKDIALYYLEGKVYATDNICTHGLAKLSDGFVEDGQVECPLHQGKFCIQTGKALCAPLETDIPTYAAKIENNEVQVALK